MKFGIKKLLLVIVLISVPLAIWSNFAKRPKRIKLLNWFGGIVHKMDQDQDPQIPELLESLNWKNCFVYRNEQVEFIVGKTLFKQLSDFTETRLDHSTYRVLRFAGWHNDEFRQADTIVITKDNSIVAFFEENGEKKGDVSTKPLEGDGKGVSDGLKRENKGSGRLCRKV